MSNETETAVREELDRVLESAAFAQSESLKKFLRHVVEAKLDGRDAELKEIILGSEVFERGSDYDPRIDPIVRVQATRLRSKLRECYEERETPPLVVIGLPKGSYVPVFSSPGAEDVADDDEASSRSKGALLSAVVLAVLAILVWRFWPASAPAEPVQSLAVLPFTDMSPDADHAYYGDGVAEEITTTLASIDSLDVVPRTTAFSFRERDLGTLHDALAVDAVLQGSVRKAGDELRISAQLLRADDGQQIWTHTYEAEDANVFQVQEAIANDVALAVERELGLTASTPPSPEAYEAYLKGRFELTRATPASLDRAIDELERAIDLAPTYAPAHAGLVQAYVLNVLWGFAPPDGTRDDAKQAAERALALDGHHPEAIGAAAAYELIYEWDLDEASAILGRADGSPSPNDEVHTMKALVHAARGELDAASDELRSAIALAPNAPFLRHLDGTIAFYAGRDDEALATCDAVDELAPDYQLSSVLRARVLAHQGDIDAASAALERFEAVSGGTPLAIGTRGVLEAHAGREDEARATLEALRTSDYAPPAFRARILTVLGDTEAALDELEAARDNGTLPIFALASDPEFDPLRAKARFGALLDVVGVSQ